MVGKGAIISSLLPELAFSFTAKKPFFLLITGGGVSQDDLNKSIFPASLEKKQDYSFAVQEVYFAGKNLSHHDAVAALTGVRFNEKNNFPESGIKFFHTSHLPILDNARGKDKATFEAALSFKNENPGSSVICYLNEADAAHFSEEAYRQAIQDYGHYAKQLTESLVGRDKRIQTDIIIGSELGRDIQPSDMAEGWHHVCEESRKTICLWISPSNVIPKVQYHEEIRQYLLPGIG